jgi:hypothetical protein
MAHNRSLFRILLIIATMLGALCILGLPVVTLPILHILSQFMSAPSRLHYAHLLHIFYTFVGPFCIAFSFPASTLSNFRHILM